MRLYLSSFRLGDHDYQLPQLAGEGKHAAIIANAQDHLAPQARDKKLNDAHAELAALGFTSEECDLRNYFGDNTDSLREDLAGYDMLWAIGGSAFVLRSAMAQSGFDRVIHNLLADDRFVYAGYSAGVCVLAPRLNGLELCDDPNAVAQAYNMETIWTGLGILDEAIAPHYDSDHPEAAFAQDMVSYFDRNAIAYRALRDGDVLIRKGEDLELFARTRAAPDTAQRQDKTPDP